jgi:DNA modification methylase
MAGNSKTSTLVRHARLDAQDAERAKNIRPMTPHGLKPKDLVGIPWRVAFALQDDGWYLRSDIIWHKPAPMPESVTDRCTRSHEYVFMFSKSARYYYDADAIKERSAESSQERANYGWNGRTGDTKGALTVGARTGSTLHKMKSGQVGMEAMCPTMVNKRDVWTVQTGNCKDAHFAVFPPDLIKPCVLAGCPIGGTVLDPFGGSGTTGMVAIELGRKAILIELNPEYVELAKARCDVTPGLPL